MSAAPLPEVTDLYGLPIEDFTAARNVLADEFKAAGNSAEAVRIRALKKPSLVAWTVNQLARNNSANLEELFQLRDEIEVASSAGELRRLTEDRRKLLTGMLSEARTILSDGGHAATSTTLEKISQTLLAADEDSKDALLSGTLDRELTPSTSSFGAFGSFDAAVVTFEDPDESEEPDPRLVRLRREAEEAERVADELEAFAVEAEDAAVSARERSIAAQRKAVKARERADKAASKT